MTAAAAAAAALASAAPDHLSASALDTVRREALSMTLNVLRDLADLAERNAGPLTACDIAQVADSLNDILGASAKQPYPTKAP